MAHITSGASLPPYVAPPPVVPEPDPLPLVADYGQSPSVAAQPPSGQMVKDAVLYNGKVYLGYGDWNNNTGPIDVAYFDTVSKTFGVALASVPTESIDRYRIINGDLYAPWTDSREAMGVGEYGYATNAGGTWHNVNTGITSAEHCFDMTYADGALRIVGGGVIPPGAPLNQALSHGVALKSTDNGTSWSMDFVADYQIESLGPYSTGTMAIGSGNNYFLADGAWHYFMDAPSVLGISSKTLQFQGMTVTENGWFASQKAAAYPGGAMTCIHVDDSGQLWGVQNNHLYQGSKSGPYGVTWTRVGHLDWNTYQTAKICVDATANLIYVMSANGYVRTANVPSAYAVTVTGVYPSATTFPSSTLYPM